MARVPASESTRKRIAERLDGTSRKAAGCVTGRLIAGVIRSRGE